MRRLGFACLVLLVACRGADDSVVVYVSHDQVFSEPILRDFERDTGIRVLPVYDTEEAKGTGVMNRLLAERNNPQADVYWANEPIRAELLKQEGVSESYRSPSSQGIPAGLRDPDGHWTGFAARARVFVVHKDIGDPPRTIAAYSDPSWRGRGVIANPLFGTTTTHMAALASLWGADSLMAFLGLARANSVVMSTSNGESADLVAQGAFAFSLVDVDDAISRLRRGDPITMIYPDQAVGGLGTLLLPNAVLLIRGGPNPENGRRLIDYLLSPETERKLAASDAAQVPLHEGVAVPPDLPPIENVTIMDVDYTSMARLLDEIQPLLQSWVESQP
ncbi:MAG: extracellular solute-binding protein [Longimicrobiales bacterium]